MSRPSRYGKMQSSFDSDGNSRGTSPPVSPRGSTNSGYAAVHGSAAAHTPRPMYYVQSPSRDSFSFIEGGDNLSQSYARSNVSVSPVASPLHKTLTAKILMQQQQQQQHHQVEVNQFHLPGNQKPGSKRVLPQPANAGIGATPTSQKKGYQPWGGSTIHEEEEHYPSLIAPRRGLSRWCTVFLSIIFALVGIVVVGIIYWLVCRPSSPRVQVKNIAFQSFLISEGNDATGVPTQVVSLNCAATLVFNNPSKFFGFHVNAPDVQLIYQEVVVAEAEMHKFFQKKKSSGVMNLSVRSIRTPVYGAGPNLMSAFGSGTGVPLKLVVNLRSRANVIWKVVRPLYKSSITCDLVLGNYKDGSPKLLSSQCNNKR